MNLFWYFQLACLMLVEFVPFGLKPIEDDDEY